MDNEPEVTPSPSVNFFNILPAYLLVACLGLLAGVVGGGLAAMYSAYAAIDECYTEVQATAKQVNTCAAQLEEDMHLIRGCTERLNSLPREDKLIDGLRSCTQNLEKATVLIKATNAKCDGVVQSLNDDIDKFAEDTVIINECSQHVLNESALHLTMVDHLNQVGLENLTLEADSLEYDGEQLLMNNCAYSGDDECTPMAMQVTIHDNGTFMLGDPKPLEQ